MAKSIKTGRGFTVEIPSHFASWIGRGVVTCYVSTRRKTATRHKSVVASFLAPIPAGARRAR